ncbi:MAG: hypothetical protein CMF62_07630 [Magnetococcales bacterium]|nr:hypothetical protein [Magnetococcales bacterium]|tara:strand:+ start:549705 stop:550487 length:783 start_codon:yes stop_codon:yes gene_type:complete
MVIINPNAPSVSNLGSNRADGQVESTQVDARQSQRARQPQVAQQPTATETANAARPNQGNNNIPLLNNRDAAVSNAIQRNAEPVGREARADNDTATIQTAAINVAQAQAPAETLQRLADAAQARLDAPQQQAPGQTVAELVSEAPRQAQQPQAAPVDAPAADVDVNVDIEVPAAPAPQAQQQAAVGFGGDAAPAAPVESPEFVPPAPAFQVLQNSQQRLNDILLPDFANFIGLRSSLPAQTQAEQIVEGQPAPQPVDVEV